MSQSKKIKVLEKRLVEFYDLNHKAILGLLIFLSFLFAVQLKGKIDLKNEGYVVSANVLDIETYKLGVSEHATISFTYVDSKGAKDKQGSVHASANQIKKRQIEIGDQLDVIKKGDKDTFQLTGNSDRGMLYLLSQATILICFLLLAFGYIIYIKNKRTLSS